MSESTSYFEEPLSDDVLLLRAIVCAAALGGPWLDRVYALVGDPADGYRILLPLSGDQRNKLKGFFGPPLLHLQEHVYLSFVNQVMQYERQIQQEQIETAPTDRTCLYRFIDDHGRLLYVGVAYEPDVREKQHRASQRWAPLIDSRLDEWFDNREDAMKAELHAIRNESPLFNEAGRPRLPSFVGEVL